MRFSQLVGSLSRLVFWVSVVATIFVLLGLAGLIYDEVRGSSTSKQTEFLGVGETSTRTEEIDIAEPDPPAAVERLRESRHTGAREAWDDVGDVILSPFMWARSSEGWVQRLLASGIALLVYLLGFQLLADVLRRMSNREMREAQAERIRKESSTGFRSPS
jgi:hypothetical protein